MKSDEIREMTIAEIKERIKNDKEMLLKLKINHHVSSLENPMKIKYARRTIARLKTEVTKRESEEVVNTNSGKSETVSDVSADTSDEASAKSEAQAKKPTRTPDNDQSGGEAKTEAVKEEQVTSE